MLNYWKNITNKLYIAYNYIIRLIILISFMSS